METLTIQRLSRRYHLRPSERDLTDDLDRAIERAFGDPLDDALTRLGLDGEEAICLRRVRVRLAYDPERPDGRTGEAWSELIVDAIRRTLAEHGGHHSDYLVRYPSRRHGLVDFALEVSAGRVRRAWAWNQLGWSQLPDPPSLSQARQQLVQALHREPALLLPIFLRLAQADRLAPWLAALPETDQQALLQCLFTHAGMPAGWLNEVPPALTTSPETGHLPSGPASVAIQRSHIARHLSTQAGVRLTRGAIPARHWALLGLLEQEPALFRRASRIITEHVASAETQWRRLTGDTVPPNKPAPTAEPSHEGEPDSYLRDLQSPSTADGNANDWVPPFDTTADDPRHGNHVSADPFMGDDTSEQNKGGQSDWRSIPRTAHSTDLIEPDPTTAPAADSDDASFAPWLEPRVHQSEWGGLFYLLPLLDDPPGPGATGIATALFKNPAFAQRSLAWVFYHFFRRLFEHECEDPRRTNGECPANRDTLPPFPEADPSLRLLSLLPVDEAIPHFEAPTRAEQDALETQVYRCTLALQGRLPQPEPAPRGQWRWLCQRPARLHLDTAWIDVHFPLDRLDTDIRKAGLDPDPDYVPWLGKVVKLHYD